MGLPGVRRVAAVLIGSGAGNLTVEQASRALVAGFARAIGTSFPGSIDEVTLVEVERLRAEQLRLALDRRARQMSSAVVVDSDVHRADGGRVGVESAAVFAICGLARLVRSHDLDEVDRKGRRRTRDPIRTLLESVPSELQPAVRQQLGEISDDHTSVAVVLGEPQVAPGNAPATRISVVRDGDGYRWAALHGTSHDPGAPGRAGTFHLSNRSRRGSRRRPSRTRPIFQDS